MFAVATEEGKLPKSTTTPNPVRQFTLRDTALFSHDAMFANARTAYHGHQIELDELAPVEVNERLQSKTTGYITYEAMIAAIKVDSGVKESKAREMLISAVEKGFLTQGRGKAPRGYNYHLTAEFLDTYVRIKQFREMLMQVTINQRSDPDNPIAGKDLIEELARIQGLADPKAFADEVYHNAWHGKHADIESIENYIKRITKDSVNPNLIPTRKAAA
jgi:hypothetical protein